tara:strand:- start:989 stop:1717 length:729 start_codon:yes stop_codon:yes gene_type:complete
VFLRFHCPGESLKNIVFTLIFAGLGNSVLAASISQEPIAPIYAADQEVVTTKAMELEQQQFEEIASLNSSKARLTSARLVLTQIQKDYDRTKKLVDAGRMSEAHLQSVKLRLMQQESYVVQIEGQMLDQRTAIEVSQFHLLDEGNPSTDYRRSIAEGMKSSMERKLSQLKEALSSAEANRDYFKQREENGRQLLEKNIISQAEYERRVLDLQQSEEEILSTKARADGVKQTLVGLKKSIERL